MLRLPLVRLLRSVAERAVEHLLLRVTHSRVHEHCSGRTLRLQQRDVEGCGELAKDHSSTCVWTARTESQAACPRLRANGRSAGVHTAEVGPTDTGRPLGDV